jgi:general secretion pathway protein A
VAEASQAARWEAPLRDLVDLRIDVEPWEEEDTVGYVQTALLEAGSTDPIFEREALAALHALCNGNPRQVARLANFTLLAAAAEGLKSVDASVVEGAAESHMPERLASFLS